MRLDDIRGAASGFLAYAATAERSSADAPEAHQLLGDLLRPLLHRSDLIARSTIGPHGFPGDYRTLELIHDLGSILPQQLTADITMTANGNLLLAEGRA